VTVTGNRAGLAGGDLVSRHPTYIANAVLFLRVRAKRPTGYVYL